MPNSSRHFGRRYHIPVTSTASVRPLSLLLPHKKQEAVHCLTSAPAWRGGGATAWFVGGVGQPRFPRADKAINRRGDNNNVVVAVEAVLVWRMSERKKWRKKRNQSLKKYQPRSIGNSLGTAWMERNLDTATLSLRTHTQICLSAVPSGSGSRLPVWVTLASHSPWRPGVQLDRWVQQ